MHLSVNIGGSVCRLERTDGGSDDWPIGESLRGFVDSPGEAFGSPTVRVRLTPIPSGAVDLGEEAGGWIRDLRDGREPSIPYEAHVFESFLRVWFAAQALRDGGLLLHGFTVKRGAAAVVGCGVSGSGKSTLSGFSEPGTVLTDELTLLKCVDDGWRVYPTPFWGSLPHQVTPNVSYPLGGIHLLKKSDKTCLRHLGTDEALLRLMGCVVLYESNARESELALKHCAKLVEDAGVSEWTFPKRSTAWGEYDDVRR